MQNTKNKTQKTGFTLIEMLVVTGIIIVVSSVILVNGGRLGGQFILNSFAYDMALSIREAQQYGISVKNFGGNFNVPYGIHFDSSPTTYSLFADRNKDGTYDTGELVESYTITRGFKITSICATPSIGPEICGVGILDIVFKRPEPDANLSINDVSCTLSPSACQASVRIKLIAPRLNTKNIVISANGQISVQ